MKYLCLGYLNVNAFDNISPGERDSIMGKCYAQCIEFRAAGTILAESGLEHISTAKSIRPKGGKSTVTDGPFIETKEQLGSIFIVEADSMDEAVAVASKHPAAMMGEEFGFGIEVRLLQHQNLLD